MYVKIAQKLVWGWKVLLFAINVCSIIRATPHIILINLGQTHRVLYLPVCFLFILRSSFVADHVRTCRPRLPVRVGERGQRLRCEVDPPRAPLDNAGAATGRRVRARGTIYCGPSCSISNRRAPEVKRYDLLWSCSISNRRAPEVSLATIH